MRRSQLYAEALQRLVIDQVSDDDLVANVNQVVATLDETEDAFEREASRRSIVRLEW